MEVLIWAIGRKRPSQSDINYRCSVRTAEVNGGILIYIKELTKKFKTGNKELVALNKINLEIEEGSFVSIVGRSGSGKSTLLHLIGLLDKPTSGSIIVGEKILSNLKAKEQARYRNKHIGFIFQSFHLEPTYTAHENVEMPLLIGNLDRDERLTRIVIQLERVGLLDRRKEIVNNLSGGERQRIAIARALVNEPKLILADEPCGNLDTKNGKKVMDILRSLTEDGITVILVTHNLNDAEVGDRIITLEDGIILDDKKTY